VTTCAGADLSDLAVVRSRPTLQARAFANKRRELKWRLCGMSRIFVAMLWGDHACVFATCLTRVTICSSLESPRKGADVENYHSRSLRRLVRPAGIEKIGETPIE
jgi:hypothetical protein